MEQHHDDDGDSITLTDEDREHIAAEIEALNAELSEASHLSVLREVCRRARHLNDELKAGRRLPMPEETRYDYEIVPRKESAGGGWRLYIIEDGMEVGGGTFPAESDEAAAAAWWEALDKEQRIHWTTQAVAEHHANAHLAYLRDEAWHDAAQVAGEWLDSRPQE